ncbi:MAG: hypothetical protein KJ687_04050, partial [Proteobacteria bacterium]|nr:hypothetical protein [Pseudomonadota bacterium]
MNQFELQWWVSILGLCTLILAHCFLRYPFRQSRFNVDDVNALYGPYFKVSRKGLAPDLQETFIHGSYNLFIYPMVLMWLTFTLLPRRFSPSLVRHSLTLHNLVLLTIYYVWILDNFGLQWALLSTAILALVSSQPGYGVYSLYIEFLFNLPLWVFMWLSWAAIQAASPLLLCLSGLLFSTAIMASKLMYYPLMLCPLIWCLITGHFSFVYIPAIILGALGGPLLLLAVHPPTFQMIYRQYVRIYRDFALTVGLRRWDISLFYLSGAIIPPSVFLWSQIDRITNPGAMVYTGIFFLMILFLYSLFSGMRTRYYYPILFPFLSLWACGGIILMIQSPVFNIPWFLSLVATLALLAFNFVNNLKGEYSSGKYRELVLCPIYFKDDEPEEIRRYNQYCRKVLVDKITTQVRRESSRDDFIAVLGPQSIIYLEADRRSSMRISGMCYDSYLYAWWDEDFRRSFTSR